MAGDPCYDLLIGLGAWTHARGVLGGDVATGAGLHDDRPGVVEGDLILGPAVGLTFGFLAKGAAQKVSKLGKLADADGHDWNADQQAVSGQDHRQAGRRVEAADTRRGPVDEGVARRFGERRFLATAGASNLLSGGCRQRMDHRSRDRARPLRETVPDLRESLGAMIEDAKQAALDLPGNDGCLAAAEEAVDHAAEVFDDLVAAAQSFISLFDHDLPECFVGASMGAVKIDT